MTLISTHIEKMYLFIITSTAVNRSTITWFQRGLSWQEQGFSNMSEKYLVQSGWQCLLESHLELIQTFIE